MTRHRVLQGRTQTGVRNRSRDIPTARHQLLQSGVPAVSEVPPYKPYFHRRLVPVGEQASYFGTEDTNWTSGRGSYYIGSVFDDGRGITALYHVEGNNAGIRTGAAPLVLNMYPMRFETQAATASSHNWERRAQIYWSHLITRGSEVGLHYPESQMRRAPGAISDGVVSGGHIDTSAGSYVLMYVPIASANWIETATSRGHTNQIDITHVRLLQNGVAKTDPLPVSVSYNTISGQGAYRTTAFLSSSAFLPWRPLALDAATLADVTLDLDHPLQLDVWCTLTMGGGKAIGSIAQPNADRYWLAACTATACPHDFFRYQARQLRISATQFRAGCLQFSGPEVNANFNYNAHTWQITFPNTTDWTGTNATTWKLEDGDGWTVTKHNQSGTRLQFGNNAYFEIKFDSELPEVWIYDPDGEVMESFGGLGLGIVSGGPMIYSPQSDGNFPTAITSTGGMVGGGSLTSYDQGLFYDDGSTTTMTRVLYETESELTTDYAGDPDYPYRYTRRIPVSESLPAPTPWFPSTIDIKRVAL